MCAAKSSGNLQLFFMHFHVTQGAGKRNRDGPLFKPLYSVGDLSETYCSDLLQTTLLLMHTGRSKTVGSFYLEEN